MSPVTYFNYKCGYIFNVSMYVLEGLFANFFKRKYCPYLIAHFTLKKEKKKVLVTDLWMSALGPWSSPPSSGLRFKLIELCLHE